jgi:hypothetical protein
MIVKARRIKKLLQNVPDNALVYVRDDLACGDETEVVGVGYRTVQPDQDGPKFKAVVFRIE